MKYWTQCKAPAGNWYDVLGSDELQSCIDHAKAQIAHGNQAQVVKRVDTVAWASQLDAEFLNKVQDAVERTWNAIGFDMLEILGENAENIDAIESCLDADRLATYGEDEEAVAAYRAAVAEHGWKKVTEYLAEHIPLN